MHDITKEERERVFAMYYGQRVLEKNGTDVPMLSVGYCAAQCRLLLTPVSKITDEHVIECFKVYNELPFMYNCKTGWVIDRNDHYIMAKHPKNIKSFTLDILDGNVIQYTECDDKTQETEPIGTMVPVVDKLRELGYALPYRNMSLFELRIAFDKTKL